MKKDKILIKDLECSGFHGVLEEEKKLGQKFIVSAVLSTNFEKAVVSDKCADTVNYSEVSHFIVDTVKGTKYDLIETLADKLARMILINYPMVEEVEIEVKKPWAPIYLHLDTVAVSTSRAWSQVYLGVGSNMGDSKAIIRDAVTKISDSKDCKDVAISDLITTKPYGYKDQPDFVNGVIELKTLLKPHELLRFLQQIENDADRKREIHWGPRTLDLDILLFGDEVSCDRELVIPHPEMCLRDFVLQPLCQLNPYVVHPLQGKRICDIYKELQNSSGYEKTL